MRVHISCELSCWGVFPKPDKTVPQGSPCSLWGPALLASMAEHAPQHLGSANPATPKHCYSRNSVESSVSGQHRA